MRVNGHNSIDHLTIGPGKQYWGITQGAATTFAKDVWKGLNKTKKKKGPLVGVSVPFVTLGAAGQFSYRLRNSSPTAIHDYVQDSRLRVVVNLAAKRRKKVLVSLAMLSSIHGPDQICGPEGRFVVKECLWLARTLRRRHLRRHPSREVA